MKKNGFTLVELIAVIVILAVLMVLVIPNVTESSNETRKKSYETKIESFETAAALYAQDNYKDLITGKIEKTITLKKLCESKYIKSDKEGECLIEDPRDTSKNLNNCKVSITIDTTIKKITTEYNVANNSAC